MTPREEEQETAAGTIRSRAREARTQRITLLHGPMFTGDGREELHLTDHFERRLRDAMVIAARA